MTEDEERAREADTAGWQAYCHVLLVLIGVMVALMLFRAFGWV